MDAFFRWATFVADVICVIVFTAEMVSKIQDRSLITGDKVRGRGILVMLLLLLLLPFLTLLMLVLQLLLLFRLINVTVFAILAHLLPLLLSFLPALMFPSQLLVLPFPLPYRPTSVTVGASSMPPCSSSSYSRSCCRR